jgi:tetratricopeptide (TPR) repeat protein
MSLVKKIILLSYISSATFFMIPGQLFGTNDFGYAVYLYRTGNYPGAIIELDRFIYHNPENASSSYLQLLLALSYANTAQYDNALASLSALSKHLEATHFEATHQEDSPYPADSHALLCESYFHVLNIMFRQKMFYDFQVRKEQMQALCIALDFEPERRLIDYVVFMSVAGHIYNLDWEKAKSELDELAAGNTGSNSMKIKGFLDTELTDVMEHRDKSPALGGILAIVPGLGHFYAGRPADGFRSLLFNSAFTALTVYAFYERQYVLGGVFAAVEGVLYASNIYGAVNAVQQENAIYVVQKRDEMLKMIPIPPLDLITVRRELDL